MTPSGWHDDARHRDAGHDDVHVGVWRHLRDRENASYQWKSPKTGNRIAYPRVSIEFEKAFGEHDRIFCFADISEHYRCADGVLIIAYEIKPRIESVGALVRQCAALRLSIEASYRRESASWGAGPDVLVRPVVPFGDPKIAMLREVMGSVVLAWTGSSLI